MGSSHTYHPDSHEHGLADGCPRCEEHAAKPFETLDDRNIIALVGRIQRRDEPRSENEAIAMLAVDNVMIASRRLNALGVSVG